MECSVGAVGSVCVAFALRDASGEGVLHGLCVEKVAILPKKRRKICRIGLKSLILCRKSGNIAKKTTQTKKEAMIIRRDFYLQQLIDGKQNGLVKIVTGVRRCGKSYLLFRLFYRHLIASGVSDDHIVKIALDDIESKPLRNALELYRYIKSKLTDGELFYVLLD